MFILFLFLKHNFYLTPLIKNKKNLLAELNSNMLNHGSRVAIPLGDSAHCDSQTERSRSLKVKSLKK
jgi:hypothetical protein